MTQDIKKRVGVGCGVMVLRNNEILLGKRHEDPAKADSEMHGEGTWTMPGGKLDFGESFEGAVARETLEETGIVLDADSIRLVSLANNRVPDAHFVTVGFVCERFSGEAKVMEPDEITEWRWFPIDAVPANLFPPSREILENYLSGTIYKI